MSTEITLSQNILNFRKQLGYTQEVISKYLGISQPAYNKYETGETNIPTEAIEKLATLFQVDEYDLMEENPEILQTSLACAYRADNLNATDLAHIASFQKIVKNYIMMCHELENAN